MNDPYACPLCGHKMYPLEIDGAPLTLIDQGDVYSTYYTKTPDPVYFQNEHVTLYACELCGMVRMFRKEQM